MPNHIRDLLISLSSHMAYMQGQLEAHHQLDDLEDFYWYRESVLLRQKVTDALADEPAVSEGGEPTRDELWGLWLRLDQEMPDRPAAVAEFWEHARVHTLSRWSNRQGLPDGSPLADGEVAKLVVELRRFRSVSCHRAAELLERQVLVPVSDAFALVQKKLEQLAGNQEMMMYRWSDGDWTIHHSNPSPYVQLGEVSGEYSCTDRTLEEAVNKIAALLPSHAIQTPQQQETNND